MSKTIEGIYENGIIKPLEKISAKNSSHCFIIFPEIDKSPEYLSNKELLKLAEHRAKSLESLPYEKLKADYDVTIRMLRTEAAKSVSLCN